MKPKGMSETAWMKLHIRVKGYMIKYEKQLRETLESKRQKNAS
ncbi:hypothetical protein J2T13_004914 [Paenibacillus sp. DS2015]